MSDATIALKVGVPDAPLGAAKKVFAVCDFHVALKFPLVVIAAPVVNSLVGNVNPTELTKVVELIVISFPEPVTVTFVPGLIFTVCPEIGVYVFNVVPFA